jgi:hypothetical protein
VRKVIWILFGLGEGMLSSSLFTSIISFCILSPCLGVGVLKISISILSIWIWLNLMYEGDFRVKASFRYLTGVYLTLVGWVVLGFFRAGEERAGEERAGKERAGGLVVFSVEGFVKGAKGFVRGAEGFMHVKHRLFVSNLQMQSY